MFLALMWDAKGDVRSKILGHIDHNSQTLSIFAMMSMFTLVIVKISLSQGVFLEPISKILYGVFVSCGYVFMRIGIFNQLYNHYSGLERDYIGTTDDIFDKHLRKLPSGLVVTIQVLATFAALVCAFSDRILERI